MQFSLMSLLLAFVVVWLSLATFGIAGLAVAAVLVGIAAYVRTAQDMRKALQRVLAVGLVILFICLFVPSFPHAGERSRRSQCASQLKQIVLGLHTYHDVYGCFPPAYVAGPDGEPWHSWRVLILPFVEETRLYEQYDFNEPWNGPNNSKLAGQKPYVYRCPSDPDSPTSLTTNYAAVVGPRAAWAGSEPRKLGDFRDGTDPTILVVEVAGSGIHWMEPRDLSFDQARTGIHPPGPGRISSHHTTQHGYFYHEEHLANVALADLSVRCLPERIGPAALEAMLTIDGKEQIDLDAILEPRPRLYWSRILAPIMLIVSYLILLLRPRRNRAAQASSE